MTFKPFNRTWKYFESFTIGLAILLAGTGIEVLFQGMDVGVVGAPYNIYIASVFALWLIFLHIFYRDSPVIKWLSGVPAAISAISLFAVLVLLLGMIPQSKLHSSHILVITGLSHLKTSFPFLFIQVYFLTILGMVTLRRILPLKFRNIGFFLNHFGLWLVLLAGCLGSGDLQHLTISLLKNEQGSNIGVAPDGKMFKLPFILKLIDFNIDEYDPKIVFVDAHTGDVIAGKEKSFPFAEKGLKTKFNEWNIEVVDYLPRAIVFDSLFQRSNERGNYPAAHIKAINSVTHDTVKGWISTGSYLQDPSFLSLKGKVVMALTTPEARKYSSKIEATVGDKIKDTITLEVNKPFHINGWTIYQVSYDQSKGKWSSLSVLDAVSDPWLKVIYTGIFMLLAGALYMFWMGRGKTK